VSGGSVPRRCGVHFPESPSEEFPSAHTGEVVEDEHLLGIVTIEDILRALEHGYIDDPVRGWMTKQVVTVGERWPLTETMSVRRGSSPRQG